MSKDQLKALIAIPAVILIGYGFAVAGSNGRDEVSGLSPFVASVVLAFGLQWLAFIPSYIKKTEGFFDLVGSVSYVMGTALAMGMSTSVDARSLMLGLMVFVWAARLGYFLFTRIHKAGKDARFDAIKTCFVRFLAAWTLQGLWITFTAAAAWAAITSEQKEPFGIFALIGSLLWLSGFLIEIAADRQKGQFKENPENKGKFIRSGLWSRSRHPNYFGEIVLWTGVAIIAFPVLQGWQWVCLSSPVFITILLTRVSGIPLLEKRADDTWGGQEDYEAYKKSTPVLVPRFR
ncbi:MAG: DUF1295 domain-containing protein [Opitutales bacterium]|nr:DUF1295 domain-containing protein [Opitutales bacterium]MBT5166855.1 DUF1295 domain-containing protein [Opitutales bacterium]MBT5813087.1 DUF1295 domain-containing protein [Opitutales bacterium]